MSKKKAMFFKQELALGTQIYTWSDAASPEGVTEANSIYFVDNVAGIGAGSRSGAVVETTDSYLGSYSIQIIAYNTFSAYQELWFPSTIGKSYTISFYAKTGVGSDDCRWRSNAGFVVNSPTMSIPEDSTNWVKYEWTGEASATNCQMYLYALNGGVSGEYFLMDNISILEL